MYAVVNLFIVIRKSCLICVSIFPFMFEFNWRSFECNPQFCSFDKMGWILGMQVLTLFYKIDKQTPGPNKFTCGKKDNKKDTN